MQTAFIVVAGIVAYFMLGFLVVYIAAKLDILRHDEDILPLMLLWPLAILVFFLMRGIDELVNLGLKVARLGRRK